MPHCPFPLAQEFIHVQSDCDILRTFRVVMLHGVLLLEFTNLAISVERTLATLQNDYERRPYAFYGGVLLMSSHVMGAIMSFAYWTWKLPIAVHNFMRVGLNVLCFLYCATLYRYNRRLNEANHKAGGRLSVRYQLTENERIIRFLFPLQILHCVVQTALCFGMSFVQETTLRELSVTFYFLV